MLLSQHIKDDDYDDDILYPMKDYDDILKRQCNIKVYVQDSTLIRKFSMCSEDLKFQLFKSYFHTAQIWWNYTRTALNKLNDAYDNVFGLIYYEPNDRWCYSVVQSPS